MTQTKKRIRQRMLVILFILSTCMIWIIIRLFWIQAVTARSYSSHRIDLVRNSVIQRQKGLVLGDGRGQFYDRNMHLLTGGLKSALIAFPTGNVEMDENDKRIVAQNVERLATILHTPLEGLQKWLMNVKEPDVWKGPNSSGTVELTNNQAEYIAKLDWPYVQVAKVSDRYRSDFIASHLLGFIGQDPERITSQFSHQLNKGDLTLRSEIGGSGLEKTMQRWLRGDGSTSLSLFVNPQGEFVQGLGVRTIGGDNRHYPLKLVTTIDHSAQQIVDQLLRQSGIKEGAVVVLDTTNGDIIAMASAPGFDPNHVQPDQRNWNNRALQMTVPGSIYKTVIAAAALDEGVVTNDELFECKGSLGKYHFHCWKKEGHGIITFEQAFADSCNVVFAKVAERLTDVQIEKYAKKLGLLTPVGWSGTVRGEREIVKQLDAEDAGQLFAEGTPRTDNGVRIQTAIGQRDVRVTPLQAANLIVSLLHGGEVLSPRAVSEIRFQDDMRYLQFEPNEIVPKRKGISVQTSNRLLGWMREVVTSGTAMPLKSAKWKLAGKTGTAETIVDGRERVNQWFIGYGPTTSPKYAIAVVAENVSPQAANLVFPFVRKMMDTFADQPLQ